MGNQLTKSKIKSINITIPEAEEEVEEENEDFTPDSLGDPIQNFSKKDGLLDEGTIGDLFNEDEETSKP